MIIWIIAIIISILLIGNIRIIFKNKIYLNFKEYLFDFLFLDIVIYFFNIIKKNIRYE